MAVIGTVGNMLGGNPSSGGQGRLLPTLQQAGSIVSQMLSDIRAIESSLPNIISQMRQFNQVGDSALNRLRSGGGSGNSVPGLGIPNPFAGGAGQPPTQTPTGGGQQGGQGGGHFALRDIIARGATTAVSSAMGGAGQMYQNDLMYNRLRILAGGNMSTQFGMPASLQRSFQYNGQAGYYSTTDRNQAVGMAMTYGNLQPSAGFLGGQALGAAITGQSGSALMGVTQQGANNPMGILQLQAMGARLTDSHGNMLPINQQANNIFRLITQGKNYTSRQQVMSDFSAFGGATNMLTSMGYTRDQIESTFMPMALAQAANGGGSINPNDPKVKSALKQAGFMDTNIATGEARVSATDRTNANMYRGQHDGLDAANDSARGLADAFNALNRSLNGLPGGVAGFGQGGISGLATNGPSGGGSMAGHFGLGIADDFIQALIMGRVMGGRGVLGRFLGGGASGAAEGGLMSRLLGGGGGLGAAEGAGAGGLMSRMGMGRLGRIGAGVGVALAGNAAGNYLHKHVRFDGSAHSMRGWGGFFKHLGNVAADVGHTAWDAGVGAASGFLVAGPYGAIAGAGIGAAKGTYDDFTQYGPPSGGAGMGAAGSPSTGSVPTQRGGGSGGGSGMSVDAGQLLAFAEQQIGTPYSWGGGGVGGPSTGFNQGSNTVGFDCSSFTQYVFAHFGIMLPRTTYDQVKCGVGVDPKNAMPGDLLFFGGGPDHVGIYLGNNQMINAPHTGTSIRIDSVSPTSASAVRRVVNGANAGSGKGSSPGVGNPLSADQSSLQNSINAVSAALGVTPYQISGGNGLTSNTVTSTRGGSGGGSAPPAPANISGNVALAKQMAAARGWTGAEWNSLYAVWNQESSFNDKANNGVGYYGIPQGPIGELQGKTPKQQIAWGLNYIAGRYHDPEAALAHKHATDSSLGSHAQYAQPGGWYDKGAWNLSQDETARVHKGEMILPKDFASAVRAALVSTGAGGGGKSVLINVYPTKVDRSEAVKLAKMVKEVLDEDDHVSTIGVN